MNKKIKKFNNIYKLIINDKIIKNNYFKIFKNINLIINFECEIEDYNLNIKCKKY